MSKVDTVNIGLVITEEIKEVEDDFVEAINFSNGLVEMIEEKINEKYGE